MITIVCKSCGLAVRVSGEEEEVTHLLGEKSDWYPSGYPCPAQGCSSKAEMVESIESVAAAALDIRDLTAIEAFHAYSGLGLPEERDCGPTAVSQALLNGKVTAVDVKLLRGSNRSVLYSLTMEDGIKLYLGSSAWGATVYRLAKPQSAVERLHEG